MNAIAWLPISKADKIIVDVIKFPAVGMAIRTSASILARDENGHTYEAVWTDHRGGYWWDLEAKSRVNPVEFFPLLN